MRAFIHTVGGRPFNTECATAWRGFKELGVECVPFSTDEGLASAAREDIVVAGLLVTGQALTLRGITPSSIDYPPELTDLLGRRVWECAVGEITEGDYPLFLKPLHEKELPAIVANEPNGLAAYCKMGPGYRVLCSEPVDFVSEWRVFVRYGQVAHLACYRGDRQVMPDVGIINYAIEEYKSAPAAYGLDLGVTGDGWTLLVEVNDGFALGCYGMEAVEYALFLSARWAELVGASDPFADLLPNGKPRLYPPDNFDERASLAEPLSNVEGATRGFCSVVSSVAVYSGLVQRLIEYLNASHRSVRNVWQWLAIELGLKTDAMPDNQRLMFPRAWSVRFAVDLALPDTLGSISRAWYDQTTEALTLWIPPDAVLADREGAASLLLDYAEQDASADGFQRVFALADDDESPETKLFRARDYRVVPDKDEDRLARALGARVVYGSVLEKEMGC